MPMALFGTNGVRGKLDLLTPQLSFSIAASFGSFSKGGRVCLARDMRITSPMLHSAALSGLLSSGRDVLDLGLCSSPVAEFSLANHRASGLIIVTASHNAPEWNALKFVDGNGVAISRERGEAIEKAALLQGAGGVTFDGMAGKAPKQPGAIGVPMAKAGRAKKQGKAGQRAFPKQPGRIIPCPGASEQHAHAVLKFVNFEKIRKRKLKLALDFGNGTSALSREVFERLGCEIIAMNEKIDGTFPGRPSEPSEQNVQQLCALAREESCDFGVAWDGDSDRVVFVDERGKWIVGDKGFAISALAACKERRSQKEKFVVTTVATSRAAEEACAEFGARAVYTAVGAPYLSEKVFELGSRAVSGGEEVGGIIWPRFSLAKDGILAAAKIAELACENGLSALVSELPEYFNSKAKLEASSQEAKKRALLAARKHAEGGKGKVTTVDGVRADFDDSWAIVRASGTENYMRIFAEGKTQARAEALLSEYQEVVRASLES